MRFDRIRLSNFKCYADADLRLDSGVTVIHGLNGSGKSSLLEACFFALYGAKALEKTLDDVVTIGADDAEIELWFTHAGSAYHLERRIRATGERAQTAKCTLETPETTIEGARDVRRFIVELLRMDAEAFVNCAYVRQGEVNKLINATPAQRQDMIDDLLQLGTLEQYRERTSQARLAVGEVLSTQQGILAEKDDQIESMEAKNLLERRDNLRTERNDVEAQIERHETNREQATEALSDARSTLEAHQKKRDQLRELTETISTLKQKIAETEQERETITERVSEHRESVETRNEQISSTLSETELESADSETVAARRATLIERRENQNEQIRELAGDMKVLKNKAESLAAQAKELDTRAESADERAAELADEAAEVETKLESALEQIESIDEQIEDERKNFSNATISFGESESLRDSLADELDELRERETHLRAKLTEAHGRIEEGESLLAEGKCPECGQTVDGSPHVDSLDEHRERAKSLEEALEALESEKSELDGQIEAAEALLSVETSVRELETRRENAANLLEERQKSVEEKREQSVEHRDLAAELREKAEAMREQVATKREQATEAQSKLGSLNGEQSELRTRIDRLETLATALDDRAEHEATIERLRERRSDLATYNDERRETLSSARDRKQELDEQFDEAKVETAREEKERAKSYLEDVQETLEKLTERRSEIDAKLGGIENAIETLESVRQAREELAKRVAALESLQAETEELQEMYGDLRADLRQHNVESLERMLNEVFELVYQNDSYSRIELSGDYELTVFQKDGNPLDPDQLSGGERALFNLSLRCAIYRLLSEGIEGAAPMPPLILDEPTVFLDSGHVSRLIALVDSMRSLGVEQIVVVSHDDELVGAADQLVTVTKDATTNRSRVETSAFTLGEAAD